MVVDGGERARNVTDQSVPKGIRRARLDEVGARGPTPWSWVANRRPPDLADPQGAWHAVKVGESK